MKGIFGLIVFVSAVSSISLAQALKSCSSEKLNCKMESVVSGQPRQVMDSAVATFSGADPSDPGIAPASCFMTASLKDKSGRLFNVSLNDSDYLASIMVFDARTFQATDAADVVFKVTAQSPFYYRVGNQILTCELMK